MAPRIVVLGAAFRGLELSTVLSDAFGAEADVTLIDKRD
jgi:sulfide:quinone oxidoreductase